MAVVATEAVLHATGRAARVLPSCWVVELPLAVMAAVAALHATVRAAVAQSSSWVVELPLVVVGVVSGIPATVGAAMGQSSSWVTEHPLPAVGTFCGAAVPLRPNRWPSGVLATASMPVDWAASKSRRALPAPQTGAPTLFCCGPCLVFSYQTASIGTCESAFTSRLAARAVRPEEADVTPS